MVARTVGVLGLVAVGFHAFILFTSNPFDRLAQVPADGRDLNYAKFVEQGEQKLTQTAHGEDYNSHNTLRLDVQGMKQLLLKLDFMRKIARGEHAVAEE